MSDCQSVTCPIFWSAEGLREAIQQNGSQIWALIGSGGGGGAQQNNILDFVINYSPTDPLAQEALNAVSNRPAVQLKEDLEDERDMYWRAEGEGEKGGAVVGEQDGETQKAVLGGAGRNMHGQ